MTIEDLKVIFKDMGAVMVLFVLPAMFLVIAPNVPGWALFGVFFISGILAQSILTEKRTGAFRCLVIAPLSRTAVLLGKLAPHVIVNLIQIVMLFLVGYFVLPLTGLPRLEWVCIPRG